MIDCWIKAILLVLAVTGTFIGIIVGAAGVVVGLAVGGTALSEASVWERGKGRIIKQGFKWFMGTALVTVLAALLVLITIHAKNTVCARGFKGAWHSVWVDDGAKK